MSKVCPTETKKYKAFDDKSDNYADYKGTRLLPMEEMNVDSIDTITFYEKNDTTSIDETLDYIKDRLSKIVAANPWVLWFINYRKKSENFEKGGYFEQAVGEEQPSYLNIISVHENDDLFKKISYKQLCRICRPHRLKHTFQMDSDSHAFRYVVFINSDKTRLAIYSSVSHMIVDGCGSYTLWNMFGSNNEIVSLNAMRDLEYEQRMAKETSMIPVMEYMNPCEMIPMFLRPFYKAMRPKKFGKAKVNTFLLSNEELEKRKQTMKAGSPTGFVSSNDVINNWYMNEMGNLDYCEMGCNNRNRVSEITNKNAGNYLNAILLDREDMSSPAKHRERLEKVLKGQGMTEVPPVRKFWFGYKALSTNWSGFYLQNDLPGFQETLHQPVMDFELWKILGVSILPEDIMIIYAPRAGETGIVCVPYSAHGPPQNDFLEHDMVVGRIFPQKSVVEINDYSKYSVKDQEKSYF